MANRRPRTESDNTIILPIYQNAEFFFGDTEEFRQYTAGRSKSGRYGRYSNPSWTQVEDRLASLEGCHDALLFPSGMSALTAVAVSVLRPGDSVIYLRNSYRNIRALFEEILAPFGICAVSIDQSDIEQCRRELTERCTPRCKAAFVEMPSNPHLYLVDLGLLRRLLGRDGLLVVDSTFASPVFFKPLEFGADLVVHSCTKYLGGHGDLMSGSVAGPRGLIEKIRRIRDVTGCIPDAHGAFLLNRSLDTLDVRMRHLQSSALAVARFLEKQAWVTRVYYTGLDGHPHAELIQRYLRGHGGVVSFELDATGEQTSAFVDALRLPYMGTNFGSSHALVEQCSVFTYYQLSPEDRLAIGISDSLIRLSVGMEQPESVIEDLTQARRRVFGQRWSEHGPSRDRPREVVHDTLGTY